METIRGYVDGIIFRNEENGYTVLTLVVKGKEITCVGSFPYIGEGELLEAEGSFAEHPVYGEQFQVENHRIQAPEDGVVMERYLASGAVKGIGAALAARISAAACIPL